MDRKVLVFAAVGFASALAIYGTSATHAPRTDDGRMNRLARLEALMDEGKVQYKASFFKQRIRARAAHAQIAGLDPVEKTVTEIPAPKPADDAAKKAAEKKAADEKKKKEDEAKKKKKKKKKKKAGEPEAAAGTPASGDDEKKDDEKPAESGPSANMNGTGVTPYGAVDPNKNPQTYEEWIAYLFTNPSFEKTSKFIQLTQIGNVKTEIFYAVVEKMLLSQAPRMHEFAVMSLGSYANLQSFELLFAVGNEPSMDEKVKSQARSYLSQYGGLSYVGILGAAAAVPDDAEMSNYAISLILEQARANLAASSTTPATPGASDTTRTPASSAVKVYQSLVTTLNAVAQNSPDANLRASAQNAASAIAALLPDTTPATQTAAN